MAFRSKLLIILSVSFVGLVLYSQISKADADHLVISQIQITGGVGKTTNDFIEIYNPTGADIDLKGMRLVKRTKTGTADTLIKSWTAITIVKSHGFYLWANSNFTDISATPDVTTSLSLADDNSVAIRNGPNDTGTILDSLAWGEATNSYLDGSVFSSNPSANESIERNLESLEFFLQAISHPRNSSTTLGQATPTPSETPTPEPTPTPTETPAPVPTSTPTASPTPTPTPQITPTPSATATPTAVPTQTPEALPSSTPVFEPVPTSSSIPVPVVSNLPGTSLSPAPTMQSSPTTIPELSPSPTKILKRLVASITTQSVTNKNMVSGPMPKNTGLLSNAKNNLASLKGLVKNIWHFLTHPVGPLFSI